MHRLVIEWDPLNGRFQVQAPKDSVVVLGMLHMALEAQLAGAIRPSLNRSVQPVGIDVPGFGKKGD